MGLLANMKLKLAKAAEIPLRTCPECGNKSDRASAINEPGIFQSPVGGDTTVCGQCLVWLVFRDDLSMRVMTSEEIKMLSETERAMLIDLTRALVRVNELSAKRPKVR